MVQVFSPSLVCYLSFHTSCIRTSGKSVRVLAFLELLALGNAVLWAIPAFVSRLFFLVDVLCESYVP